MEKCINSECRRWIYSCREVLYSQPDHPVPAPGTCRAQWGHSTTSLVFSTLPPCQAGKPPTAKETEKCDEKFLCSYGNAGPCTQEQRCKHSRTCFRNGQLSPLSLGRGLHIRSCFPHAGGSAEGDSLVWLLAWQHSDGSRGSSGTLAWVRCEGSTQQEQGISVLWDKPPVGRSSADTRAGRQEHQDIPV